MQCNEDNKVFQDLYKEEYLYKEELIVRLSVSLLGNRRIIYINFAPLLNRDYWLKYHALDPIYQI